MGTERLAVEFERRLDGSVLLRLSGKLEQGTAALLDGILQALWDDPSPVVVDLSHVDHIDSRGLDVLLAAESGARRRSSPVEVVGIRESLRANRPLEEP
jgi:anti-anti-sigma factor